MAARVRLADTAPAVPRHVAIIMDGNGRWAQRRRLPRVMGHRRGVEAVRTVARAARSLGIEVLTLYAFSSENWRRPSDEIADLKGLLRRFLQNDVDELVRDDVRLRIIGAPHAFGPELSAMVDEAVARTKGNSGSTLAIALNYGSQDELARAVRRLAVQAASGELDPHAIAPEHLEAALDTAGLPPLDLLVRTSGEQRLSNFMLWQAAYAELLFVDTLWPDFGYDDLQAACEAFAGRQRRFGGR